MGEKEEIHYLYVTENRQHYSSHLQTFEQFNTVNDKLLVSYGICFMVLVWKLFFRLKLRPVFF